MGSKMLIDAAHPEETRVVVLRGNRVEEFDYESASRKQLRGNIYLAKVTRVEPSLQAAFVDYGGNRHGFLAFTEIHPDYYQIPVADRQALLNEEAEDESRAALQSAELDDLAAAEPGQGEAAQLFGDSLGENLGGEDEPDAEPAGLMPAAAGNERKSAEEEAGPGLPEARPRSLAAQDAASFPRISEEVARAAEHSGEAAPEIPLPRETEADLPLEDGSASAAMPADEPRPRRGRHALRGGFEQNGSEEAGNGVESVGSEDALEELPQRIRRRRMYKIQEVIKRRQVLLVQAVKEERGTKGAALTTYLSLAGRYTVLMPNTASGGGISRKITVASDRKRLREIAAELEVPEGMGLIIRTAGASRTKVEIKRDFEYLLRLWENVRDLTLKSTAPALVYAEGDLIKRSIRDLYNKEIDEVLVAGDDAYREAKDFMRMLMPSHAKNVQPYKEPEPVFIRYEVERQLNLMFSPYVTLKSGGYIVINQTEALVAIDVNSGKATREHSIEDTALKTNMEAAEEVSRQLRLRDLAGLIVIDFIDMEEKRNNRSVERKLKECLRNDRARIQVGRISHFGLMEMSRQRLRTGVLEGSTSQCQMCQGTGVVRSTESVALSVLRALEDSLKTNEVANLAAMTSVEAALYILNQKRGYLKDIEIRYGVALNIMANERLHGASFTIEKMAGPVVRDAEEAKVVQMNAPPPAGGEQEEVEQPEEEPVEEEAVDGEAVDGETVDGETAASRSGRRRRKKRFRGTEGFGRGHPGGSSREQDAGMEAKKTAPAASADGQAGGAGAKLERDAQSSGPGAETDDGARGRTSRRRGRRGGRRQHALRLKADQGDAAGGHEGLQPAGLAQAPDRQDKGESRPATPASASAASRASAAGAETDAGVRKAASNDAAPPPPPPVLLSGNGGHKEAPLRAAPEPRASAAGESWAAAPLAASAAGKLDESPMAASSSEDQRPGAGRAEEKPQPETTHRAVKPERHRHGWWQRRG